MKIIAVKVFHYWYSCYNKRLQVSTRAVKIQWSPCLLKGEKFKRTRTVLSQANRPCCYNGVNSLIC